MKNYLVSKFFKSISQAHRCHCFVMNANVASCVQRGVKWATAQGIQGRGGIQRVKLQKLKCC